MMKNSILQDPFQRKLSNCQGGCVITIIFEAPIFIKTEDRSVGQRRQIAVAADAWFENLFANPRLAVVKADLQAQVFAVAVWLAAFRFVFQVIGIGEYDGVFRLRWTGGHSEDAGHADRFQQLIVKMFVGPVGGAVVADGNQAAVRLRFRADIHEHFVVEELNGDGFAGIHNGFAGDFVTVLNDDVTPLPGFAMVFTEDGRDAGRAMFLAAGRKPDRNQQASIGQLNAVPGAGGHDIPVVFFAELFEDAGDFNRFAEGLSVVFAVDIKTAAVVFAIQQMHLAGLFIGESDDVVDGIFFGVMNHLHGQPGFAAIGAAAHQNVDVGPVAGGNTGFAIREQRSLFRRDDAGNAVVMVFAVAGGKQRGFLQIVGMHGGQDRQECEQKQGIILRRAQGKKSHGDAFLMKV